MKPKIKPKMKIDKKYYTKTLYNVLASQGYFNTAIYVCGYLMEKEPNNETIRKHYLNLLEIKKNSVKPAEDIVMLFENWLNLYIKAKNLYGSKTLKKLETGEKNE
jgi:hypothetical protein